MTNCNDNSVVLAEIFIEREVSIEQRKSEHTEEYETQDALDHLPELVKYHISRKLTGLDHVQFCISRNIRLCAKNIGLQTLYFYVDEIIDYCNIGLENLNLEFIKLYADEHLNSAPDQSPQFYGVRFQ